MDTAYLHSIDPFALRIWGSFGIRWYGLAYLAGFVAGYLVMLRMVRIGRSQLSAPLVSDFVFSVALGTIIGGRLGYCLIYSPDLLTKFSANFPYWGIFAINEGGMASHGGILGIVVASLLFARKHKVSALHLMDLTTIGGAIGIFFGRIANFINGELVGRPCAPDFLWAVKFPQDIFLWPSKAPEKLLELEGVVGKLGVSSEAWQSALDGFTRHSNRWDHLQAILTAVVDAVQSGNAAVSAALKPLLVARHPSQLYESALEGALVFFVLNAAWRVPRSHGVITGLFFSVYAAARVIGEQFRMPDPQIGFLWFGLTMGQLLSIGLFILGVVWLLICVRIPQKK